MRLTTAEWRARGFYVPIESLLASWNACNYDVTKWMQHKYSGKEVVPYQAARYDDGI